MHSLNGWKKNLTITWNLILLIAMVVFQPVPSNLCVTSKNEPNNATQRPGRWESDQAIIVYIYDYLCILMSI